MSQLALFKRRKFLPLFWTQFFGAFNDNFLKNALIILVAFQAGDVMGLPASQIVVLAGGIFILPFFLFSALAGQIADKFEKGRVIKVIKWAELGIMVLAMFGLIHHLFPLLLFVLFLMGLHSTFFGPIKYSILPQHLSPDEMVGGNALIEAGTFLAILLGTISGGVLIAGASGPVIVGFGLIGVALFGLFACYWIPRAPAVEPELKIVLNPVRPTIDAFSFARKTHSVYLSILGISWFWFLGAALLSLFAPLCKDVFHANEMLVTTLLAVFSVGIAAGSLLCEKLSRRQLELGLVPFGSIGLSVFSAALYFLCSGIEDVPVTASQFAMSTRGFSILADLFLLSMSGGLFIVPMYTLMQERSDPKQRSRVVAANNILNSLFMVVSSVFLSLLLFLHMSIPMIILTLAALNVAVSAYIYTLLPEFLLRFLAWGLSHLVYRIRVSGIENIPKEGRAVLICNHVSFVDWLVIYAGIQRPVRFVMDQSYFRGWIVRNLMTAAKVIPIAQAKDDPETLARALDRIHEELEDGQVVCIFPEGTITRTGEINEFRAGVQKIVERTPSIVIPMGLNNLWGSFFSRKEKHLIDKRPRKFLSRIGLRIGKPVQVGQPLDLQNLQQRVIELAT